MTIAMGFACKDGVVIAADRQGTTGDRRAEEVQKLFKVSDKGAIAFSGHDYNWIREFRDRVLGQRETDSDYERARKGGEDFDKYVVERFNGTQNVPEITILDAILGTFEGRARLYELGTFKVIAEETQHGRVIIGEAARTANVFVRAAEFTIAALFQDRPSPKWRLMGTTFASRFCYLLLQTLPTYESSVNWTTIAVINEKGTKIYSESDRQEILGGDRDTFEAIAEAGFGDVGMKRLVDAMKPFGMPWNFKAPSASERR